MLRTRQANTQLDAEILDIVECATAQREGSMRALVINSMEFTSILEDQDLLFQSDTCHGVGRRQQRGFRIGVGRWLKDFTEGRGIACWREHRVGETNV